MENKQNKGSPLNNDKNINNYGKTMESVVCQKVCKEKEGCNWFNWDGDCWLKTDKGTEMKQTGSATGPAICTETKGNKANNGNATGPRFCQKT